jgi:hypothetical protein
MIRIRRLAGDVRSSLTLEKGTIVDALRFQG